MTDSCDVAVVGAGPAGAAAARAAALTGARTVLIERAELPRYKRCGGGLIGLSQQAIAAAGVDAAVLLREHVGRVTFTSHGQRGFTRQQGPFLPMVMRAELDAALVEQAARAGAQVRTGCAVSGLSETRDGVTVHTAHGDLQARAVVGADGSAGRSAAFVGVTCEHVDLGLEAELATPAGGDWAGRALLDWGPVPGSYGWVFPKGDVLTVGVIGDRAAGGLMRGYYRDFLRRLGLDLAHAQHDGGHLTRVRCPGSPLRRGQVLVAGDAAGLLEPWTREGISFALRSGALAGRAAAMDPASYEAAVQAALEPEMAAGRRARAAFSRHPGVVHTVFRSMPGMWDLFARLVGGQTTLAMQLEHRPIRALVGLLGG